MPPRKVAPRLTHPDWLFWAKREHALTAEAILVLVVLCELGGEEWVCTESAANIAQHAGISRSTAQKALDRLIEITAIVPLGIGPRSQARTYRVSPSRPHTAAQLRLLATPATRRAANDDGSWLVAVPDDL
jgi:hypothetical protein